MSTIAERLTSVHYQVSETPHIEVDGEKCRDCKPHPCLRFCPAQCFTPAPEGGIQYYYAGCLECGACLLQCSREAVKWAYPKGGHGVQYRF